MSDHSLQPSEDDLQRVSEQVREEPIEFNQDPGGERQQCH
jgi:hypothetical protein